MTQPIDVAYVEIRADTKEFKTTLKKDVDKELTKVEKSSDDTAKHIEDAFSGAGAHISGVLTNVEKALKDAGGAVFTDADLVKAATGEIAKAGEAAEGSLSQVLKVLTGLLPDAITNLASAGPVGIVILIAAFEALAIAITAAAAALNSLISIASFGLALLPGLAAAAVAGFAVVATAVSGVAEAFKEQSQKAKASGAAGVSAGKQIEGAQRGILQAQKAVIKAREDEIKRIRQISIDLQRARVTEARAVDNVKNAQLALQAARALNSPRAVTEAQLQLDEANASLVEAKDRTRNLQAEKAKADKNGVEGSEQVQRALDGLAAAQERLASAQNAGAASLAKQNRAFNGLTKSAQGFVLALVAAQKTLGPVKDAIQEAFFKGTGPLIDPIAQNIKDLQPDLVRVADGFNKIFTEVLKFLGSDKAESFFSTILNGLADFLDQISPAIGPLLEAFGSLAADGSSFGEILGGIVKDGLLALADFVKNVDLKKLFEDAKQAVKDLLPVVKATVSIVVSLFKILASVGLPLLRGFGTALGVVAKVFEFLRGKIQPVFDFLGRMQAAFRDGTAIEFFKTAIKDAFDFIALRVDQVLTFVSGVLDKIRGAIAKLPENLRALGPKLLDVGKTIIGKFFEGLSAAGGLINDFTKKIANSLIRFLNRSVISGLNDGLKAVVDTLNKTPFFNLSAPHIPNIPELAKGGLATSPTIAAIAEAGGDEAVLPLSSPRAMKAVGQAIASEGGSIPAQRGSSAGQIIQVFLGDDQLVPHTVRVVNRVDTQTARTLTQKPRRV